MLLKNYLRRCVSKFQRRFQQTRAQVEPSAAPSILKGPVFRNAPNFPNRIAIRDHIASYTYANIFLSANELSKEISGLLDGKKNERVLFLCENDVNYVITLWAIWMSGQIAVPLSPLHPKNVLLYYANDTSSKLLITTSEFSNLMERVAKNTHSTLHVLDDKLKLNCAQMFATTGSYFETPLDAPFYENNDAMILYTSGTTGSPKGVVLTHNNLNSQIKTLLTAWRWTQNDVLLHTLPLHHVHGIVNALLCPLYVGAKTVMLKKFDANTVWSLLLGVNSDLNDRKISLYMAVPTIYSKLIEEYEKVFDNDPKMVEYIRNTLKSKVRLMVSGSAPLPVPVYEKWLEISGHKLLERYGMTEIGMALSNEYDSDREPGSVGVPLPGVSVAISDVETRKILMECSNSDDGINVRINTVSDDNPVGELLVKSDSVFKEYYNREEATRKEFTNDGWFRTGDTCEYSSDKQTFKMLGRTSVDIIKSGGYKISALEIETLLLAHPDVKDCAVVGVNDETWGQRVVGVVALHPGRDLSDDELTKFAQMRMPRYSVPSRWKIVGEVPKNAMGKVNKKELVRALFG